MATESVLTLPKVRKLVDSGVQASARVTPEGVVDLHVDLHDPQRLQEFRMALNRALNTWDTAPKWLFELVELAESELPDYAHFARVG